jgi:DNA repair protein RadA/Sms
MGETGLNGEVRPIKGLRARLEETKRLGFKKAFIPKGQTMKYNGLTLLEVKNLEEAIRLCLG